MEQLETILIVDDRPANLIALDALLSCEARSLITARSAKEALAVLSTEKIDLILLDVQMPDMNGFELAQIIKGRKETAGIPILFASAEKVDHDSLMKGFAEGAVDYLLKPLDPAITRAKVKVLLELERQKKALLEKNVQLEKCGLLISNSADIIGILNGKTLAIEEMNPAFTTLLGYEPDDYRGKPVTTFIDTSCHPGIEALIRTGSEKHSFETGVICRDGSMKWLNWNVVVKGDRWFVNSRDVTEIRMLNASLQKNVMQLEAANMELESFSYSVSHDLRAPLRALNGNARFMEEDFGDKLDEGALRYLRKIQYNASRMDTLINDLLAFSRIGKKELRKSTVNMDELVRHVLAEAAQAHPHRAAITVHPLPEAQGDYAMLRQVWTNLISNALKYSSRKEMPLVEVGATTREGQAEYYVRDNGAGFDMAYSGKLFGTFQRLHDVTEFEGTGIGLAIVKRIILKHGGTIRADAAPDQGACFWFTI